MRLLLFILLCNIAVNAQNTNKDTAYQYRNGFAFAPSKLDKINGLSLGVINKNIKNGFERNNGHKQFINGLNLLINPFFMLIDFNSPYENHDTLTLKYYNENIKYKNNVFIRGVNISALYVSNHIEIKGINISLMQTIISESNGLSISGLGNWIYISKGVQVAPINQNARTRGIQIGLFNKSTDLKGFQIGLWNVNGKRKLPFINWQFKNS